MLTQRTYGGDKVLVKASPLCSLEDAEVTERAGPRPPTPLTGGRAKEGSDTRPAGSGLTSPREHPGAVLSFPALQAPRRPAWPRGPSGHNERSGAGPALTFHRGGCQAAGAAGRARGPGGAAGGTREAILH